MAFQNLTTRPLPPARGARPAPAGRPIPTKGLEGFQPRLESSSQRALVSSRDAGRRACDACDGLSIAATVPCAAQGPRHRDWKLVPIETGASRRAGRRARRDPTRCRARAPHSMSATLAVALMRANARARACVRSKYPPWCRSNLNRGQP